jgi:Arc/MetJ-type ribon-helix-helix transcriptional regulator
MNSGKSLIYYNVLPLNIITGDYIIKKGKKKPGKYTTVSVPTPLIQKIKIRIEGTGFSSVSDYVTYVLREVIASLEEEEKQKPFSREEEEKVKDRLRALGYLE